MENKIPTAEEFLDEWFKKKGYVAIDQADDIEEALIEFAKLHVEAALKEAFESIPCLGSSSDIASYEEVEKAVLTAYPLTNIK